MTSEQFQAKLYEAEQEIKKIINVHFILKVEENGVIILLNGMFSAQQLILIASILTRLNAQFVRKEEEQKPQNIVSVNL
jgi:hypothetical protein